MYPEYIDAEWIAAPVLDVIKSQLLVVHPPPGQRPAGRAGVAADIAPRAIERARDGRALSADELTALFAEQRPEVIEDMRAPPTSCAGAWPARPSPSWSTATSTSPTCAWSAARSAASASPSARPTPTSTPRPSSPSVSRRRSRPGPPSSASSRASTPTGVWRTTWAGCASPRAWRPASPSRLLADGDRPHVRRQRLGTAGGIRTAARGRAGLDAGYRRRGPARRGARAHLAQQAAGRALGRDHRGLPCRGHPFHGDGHVRPHRGALGAGRAHAGRPGAASADRGA